MKPQVVFAPVDGHFLVSQRKPNGAIRTGEDGEIRWMDGVTRANPALQLQIFHWCDRYYREVWDGAGIVALDSMLAEAAQPRLAYAVRRLGARYWGTGAEFAGWCLYPFMKWTEQFPEDHLTIQFGRWSEDLSEAQWMTEQEAFRKRLKSTSRRWPLSDAREDADA